MIIVGAGMAGLVAANVLRDEISDIWERSDGLPNNHNAVLRFRSDIVSVATNIPFQEVQVMKTVEPYMNPFADMVAYSKKVTGIAQSRSIITAGQDLVTRYIAPPDFIMRLYDRVSEKVRFNSNFGSGNIGQDEYISTMPMPLLMNIMGYPHDGKIFSYCEGFVLRCKLEDFNAFGTVYVPNPTTPVYRVSVTGDELYVECVGLIPGSNEVVDNILSYALELVGLRGIGYANFSDYTSHKMKYAKINPIDDRVRKDFIVWASDRGVYSLGRFATWRPKLMTDDLIQDINVIRRLSSGDKTHNYKLRKPS